MYIKNVMEELEDRDFTPGQIADTLQVSKAMISTWKQKDNDFCPRLPIAKRIYNVYGIITYPYAEAALSGKE